MARHLVSGLLAMYRYGPPPASRTASPADMEALAWLLDNSIPIPGTGRRIGIDALIGLVPGLGDIISGGLGILVVARAAQLGLPRVVLARMLANLAVDFVIGSIPLIGDAFDLWFKANARNVGLFRRYSANPYAPTTSQWAFFGAILLGMVLLAVGTVWLIGRLLTTVIG
ncbi:MAG TPA: DUF4112 domain-containing protein [Candidatus Limnocylindria bacterium]|nr:DUF4112 domain-containing protein [Candidatus Limnocylindria bacterium]